MSRSWAEEGEGGGSVWVGVGDEARHVVVVFVFRSVCPFVCQVVVVVVVAGWTRDSCSVVTTHPQL